MKLGWDPFDELDDDSPTPAWAEWIAIVLFLLITLSLILCDS